jgi:polyisoprenoid-binding protein YceI
MSTTSTAAAAVSTWNLDPVHSVIEFRVKHMMISNVKGQFTGITDVLTLDENDITRFRVEATIDACKTGRARHAGHSQIARRHVASGRAV